MKWREGFRRIARATAVVYGAVSALILATIFNTNFLDKSQGAWSPPVNVYLRTWSGYGDARVHARSETEASEILGWDTPYPLPAAGVTVDVWGPYEYRQTPAAAWRKLGDAFAWCLGIYVVLMWLFRGLRWIARGFLGEPAQTI